MIRDLCYTVKVCEELILFRGFVLKCIVCAFLVVSDNEIRNFLNDDRPWLRPYVPVWYTLGNSDTRN